MTQQKYDAALARLTAQIEEHPGTGSTKIMKAALCDEPVRLSQIFYSLDRRNHDDVMTVMSLAQRYGFPQNFHENIWDNA